MHSKKNLKTQFLLGTDLPVSPGVYAVSGKGIGRFHNFLSGNFMNSANSPFLAAFSNIFEISMRTTFPNSKLPSFLLGIILMRAVVDYTATVSLIITTSLEKSVLTLINKMKEAHPRGICLESPCTHSSLINLVFKSLLILGRMVYDSAPTRKLSKLFFRIPGHFYPLQVQRALIF